MYNAAAALVGVALFTLMSSATASAQEPLVFSTQSGPLRVTLLGHGSVLLEYNGKVIYIDPYSKVAQFAHLPRANQIWITHEHYDHLDMAAINAVKTPTTRFVANASSAAQLQGAVTTMRNGEKTTVDGIVIEAVPAYNQVRERAPGQKYHPQGVGNGYIANFGGFRIYIAGDTEAIPEMAKVGHIDVAFLPVMLPYTMSPDEAASAARTFNPTLVLPYHTNKADARSVANKLTGSGIEVQVAIP